MPQKSRVLPLRSGSGENLLDLLVDVVTKVRPYLINLLNLNQIVAMPGYSQAVGGLSQAASRKGEAVGNRERIEEVEQ